MSQAELILVNVGTPDEPTTEAVRRFLAEFLGDPMVIEKPRWMWLPILHGIILRRRPAVVAKAYSQIWAPGGGPGGSPLAVGTRALAEAVAAEAGTGIRVSFAYRCGEPGMETVIREAMERNPNSDAPIWVRPLFAQQTASSTGTVAAFVDVLRAKLGLGSRLRLVSLSPTAPGYISALGERVQATLGQRENDKPMHLLVSFHGIPSAVDRREKSLYQRECEATFAALKTWLGWDGEKAPQGFSEATLAYQSRFGREPWIGPATDNLFASLGTANASLLVVAPSFLTAGLENIEELGIRGREQFLEAGGAEFLLAESCVAHDSSHSPLVHPGLVESLLDLPSA